MWGAEGGTGGQLQHRSGEGGGTIVFMLWAVNVLISYEDEPKRNSNKKDLKFQRKDFLIPRWG